MSDLLWGALASFGGLLIAILSFLFGKIFGQSERVLDQKRRVYEEFLKMCPSPNEAQSGEAMNISELQRQIGIVTVYGSIETLKAAGEYFNAFAKAQPTLQEVEAAGHPEFLEVMTSYNRMIWAMRYDALTWSIFATPKQNREYRPSVPMEISK